MESADSVRIDSGHFEVGYGGEEGSEEALDFWANVCVGCFGSIGCTAIFNERQSDP